MKKLDHTRPLPDAPEVIQARPVASQPIARLELPELRAAYLEGHITYEEYLARAKALSTGGGMAGS